MCKITLLKTREQTPSNPERMVGGMRGKGHLGL